MIWRSNARVMLETKDQWRKKFAWIPLQINGYWLWFENYEIMHEERFVHYLDPQPPSYRFLKRIIKKDNQS
jgi:hypothetical protein